MFGLEVLVWKDTAVSQIRFIFKNFSDLEMPTVPSAI